MIKTINTLATVSLMPEKDRCFNGCKTKSGGECLGRGSAHPDRPVIVMGEGERNQFVTDVAVNELDKIPARCPFFANAERRAG